MADETQLAVIETMDGFIQRMSQDPTFDAPKFDLLLKLKREQEDRNARAEFAAALAAAISEMPKVFKNKSNEGKKYADLEQINDIIVPILSRHGLVVSFSEDPERSTPESIGLKAFIIHRNGHQQIYYGSAEPDGTGLKGSANKTAIQARGSALSYGRRYMLLQMFNITVSGEDNNGAPLGKGGEDITPEQVAELEKLIVEAKADETGFKTFLKVARLADIRQKDFPSARALLVDKIRKLKEAKP